MLLDSLTAILEGRSSVRRAVYISATHGLFLRLSCQIAEARLPLDSVTLLALHLAGHL